MNEFLILLENAAATGWIALVVIAVLSIGLLVHDRLTAKGSAADRPEQERKAA